MTKDVLRLEGCGLYAEKPPRGKTLHLLLPGAGGSAHSELLVALEQALGEKGQWAGRLNFPYQEAGRRAPGNFKAVMKAFHAFVSTWVTTLPKGTKLVFVGKSMGGRAAVTADWSGLPVARIVCLGYPLHPAGKPEKLRDAPLLEQPLPLTLIQGTADPLCDLSLLAPVLKKRQHPHRLVILEKGNHSLVPKGSKEADIPLLTKEILTPLK